MPLLVSYTALLSVTCLPLHPPPISQALFAVIGTPCWADVAAVQESQWRRYLHHLPGRAPTLYRRCALLTRQALGF